MIALGLHSRLRRVARGTVLRGLDDLLRAVAAGD